MPPKPHEIAVDLSTAAEQDREALLIREIELSLWNHAQADLVYQRLYPEGKEVPSAA